MQFLNVNRRKLLFVSILLIPIFLAAPANSSNSSSGMTYQTTPSPVSAHPDLQSLLDGKTQNEGQEYFSRLYFGRRGEQLEAVRPAGWIDVDLSEQVVYIYEGDEIIRRFIVSTGTKRAPTIIGIFRAYEFHETTNMSGEGYFIPNVNYVIYFYKGYSFHAADWHDQFGEPMSIGCINMREVDAAWLFSWARIGTLVNIHY